MRKAKELLEVVHTRFPISPETHGPEFMGTHSLTLKHDSLIISIWVWTPEGVRSFSAYIKGDELDTVTPEQVCDGLAATVREWVAERANLQPGLI